MIHLWVDRKLVQSIPCIDVLIFSNCCNEITNNQPTRMNLPYKHLYIKLIAWKYIINIYMYMICLCFSYVAQELRRKCQDFATALLDHTRTSYELEVMLNYDPSGPAFEHGDRMHLSRLKMAVKYKQKKVRNGPIKKIIWTGNIVDDFMNIYRWWWWFSYLQFCAHPNVQQLLASIWYEGLPGFRRKNIVLQMMEILRIGLLFPIYSVAYIIAPHSEFGRTLRKPFIKFICHSASYITFLCK